MRVFKFITIAVSIALLITTADPAQASQQGRIYKDQSGAVFIYGLQPGETIETGKDFAPARFITSNACGLLIIKPSKTQAVGRIRVEGQMIDSSNLPTQLLPTCKDGQLVEVRSQPFKTGAGDVVIPLSPNRRYQISMLDRRQLRAIKVNSCGFLRIPNDALGDKPLLPTTSGTVARFAIADLPTGEQILCQRRQFYTPAGFPPQLASAMSNQTIVDEEGTAPTPPVTPPTANTAPTISAIAPQTMNMNSSITVNFTIEDAETPANQLTLSTSQHDPLVPNSGIVFSGSGANRTITITPAANSSGVAALFTITVSDGTQTTSINFPLTVINNGGTIGFIKDGGNTPPPPPPTPPRVIYGICKIPNKFLAGALRAGSTYDLGFDDWADTYTATADSNGVATFDVPNSPEDEWSDGLRNAYVYDQYSNVMSSRVLRDIPPCN